MGKACEINTASKKATKRKLLMAAGVLMITTAGFILIPPMLKKCSNKIYKASVKKDDIDFDSLEPEIVRKEESRTGE